MNLGFLPPVSTFCQIPEEFTLNPRTAELRIRQKYGRRQEVMPFIRDKKLISREGGEDGNGERHMKIKLLHPLNREVKDILYNGIKAGEYDPRYKGVFKITGVIDMPREFQFEGMQFYVDEFDGERVWATGFRPIDDIGKPMEIKADNFTQTIA